jgi:hypothetical protein
VYPRLDVYSGQGGWQEIADYAVSSAIAKATPAADAVTSEAT